jgi:nucleotide-binding universal stress UspA family protein
MIKDVIVNLDVQGERDVAADFAISLARRFEAHLCGVGFLYEVPLPTSIFGRAAIELIEAEQRRYEAATQSAIGNFEAAVRSSGIGAETHLLKGSFATAAENFGRLARRFDIAVLSQGEPQNLPPRELVIEAALFDSGRPVLIVPYIQREAMTLNRVLVCWDGSRNAARAIGDALPLLAQANQVQVVVVSGEPGKDNEISGADIAHHLARHDLKVELKQIVADDLDVANIILSHAADFGADFMVMGGYGHSRLREFVLGGATRGILSAMTVPTLMSH